METSNRNAQNMFILFFLGRDSHLLKKKRCSQQLSCAFTQPEATASNSSLLFRRKKDKEAKDNPSVSGQHSPGLGCVSC